MNASWCDKLASTPSIGIAFEPFHMSSGAVLDRIAPFLNKLGTNKEAGYAIEKVDPLGVQLIQDEGYQYGIEPRRIFVEFRHRLKVKHISGANPTVEMLSKPEPFTKTISILEKQVVDLYEMLDPQGLRSLLRIGVVSTTVVDRKDVPPGIEKFISYLLAPWQGKSESLNFSLNSELEEHDGWTDRCLHVINEMEAENGLLNLRFDFQRTYKTQSPTKASKIAELIPSVIKSALSYFESLAEGNRFDVKHD